MTIERAGKKEGRGGKRRRWEGRIADDPDHPKPPSFMSS